MILRPSNVIFKNLYFYFSYGFQVVYYINVTILHTYYYKNINDINNINL